MEKTELIQHLKWISEELAYALKTIDYCESADEQVIFLESAIEEAIKRSEAIVEVAK